jgi:hypothetical protein
MGWRIPLLAKKHAAVNQIKLSINFVASTQILWLALEEAGKLDSK